MARKNKKRSSDNFIQIPHFILKSQAYIRCSAWGKLALIELLFQFNGKNNGDLSLPYSVASSRGFHSSNTLSKGLKDLLNLGLIEVTKQPRKTGTTFQKTKLYALTWLPIHECLDRFGNEKLEVNSRDFPSNLWKQHEPLPDIEKSKAIAKAQRANQITKDILKYVKDYQQ